MPGQACTNEDALQAQGMRDLRVQHLLAADTDGRLSIDSSRNPLFDSTQSRLYMGRPEHHTRSPRCSHRGSCCG